MILRKSTRYRTNAQIRSCRSEGANNSSSSMMDISVDGLSFKSDKKYKQGIIIQIDIPLVVPTLSAIAEVEWCQPLKDNFDVGVKFLEITKGFRIKAVEQLKYLDEYRKKILFTEGRTISPEQAKTELREYFRQTIS
jgi:hypothetical protein